MFAVFKKVAVKAGASINAYKRHVSLSVWVFDRFNKANLGYTMYRKRALPGSLSHEAAPKLKQNMMQNVVFLCNDWVAPREIYLMLLNAFMSAQRDGPF